MTKKEKRLIIVESPAKAKTIQTFLKDEEKSRGIQYKVVSSYGHVRDLKKRELSLNDDTMVPTYEVPDEKRGLIAQLRKELANSDEVFLASDEDREGEAIAWHLCEVLGLDAETTNRIVFHEITKPAILEALEHPRHIDMNLVNAQQARRVLDRLVGFKLSPVLWRKIKPSLSAGRVQSVAVRLLVEREREIAQFKSEPFYRVTGTFTSPANAHIEAEVRTRIATRDEAMKVLEACKEASFTVSSVEKKASHRSPAAPFTTSTLQQEAAHRLGFSVSQTMMVAQHLYEHGLITYMRTDSVNLSNFALASSKEEVTKLFGAEFSRVRKYKTKQKGAQEAHEAIRPTQMSRHHIDGTTQEQRLYDLIWKRTLASQMIDAEINETTATISASGVQYPFVAAAEEIVSEGYLKVYHIERAAEGQPVDTAATSLKKGDVLNREEIVSTERFTVGPQRYNEASLVRKLEELEIGRPSTYAPTISTIQQRDYVKKQDVKGVEKQYTIDTLKGDKIASKTKKEFLGKEKGRLVPTDIGTVVNDFLEQNFPDIMDYHFTANVEEEFDKIAKGEDEWEEMMLDFDKHFEPNVNKVLNDRQAHKAGEKLLGNDPKTGKPVYVKIGRFGPVVQIGSADDKEKPRFAQLSSNQSITSITLDEALSLFKLPRTLGTYENSEVSIGTGRFGPYVLHEKQYVSLPKDVDPMTITLDQAIELIEQKREQERQRHIQHLEGEKTIDILNGRYGAYLACGGKNYRLTKQQQNRAAELTYDECIKIIEAADAKKKS